MNSESTPARTRKRRLRGVFIVLLLGVLVSGCMSSRGTYTHRMVHLITFRTAKFEITKETPNPINPLAGESVLNWIRESLGDSGYEMTAPQPEDWGWYMNVAGAGGSYLVGATAEAESEEAETAWAIQIHKKRGLMAKFSGKNKIPAHGDFSALVEALVRSESTVNEIEVDKNA